MTTGPTVQGQTNISNIKFMIIGGWEATGVPSPENTATCDVLPYGLRRKDKISFGRTPWSER